MQFDAGMNVIDIGRTDVSPVSPKCVSFGNRALKAGITTSSWFISSARLLAPNPCADGMAQLAASSLIVNGFVVIDAKGNKSPRCHQTG